MNEENFEFSNYQLVRDRATKEVRPSKYLDPTIYDYNLFEFLDFALDVVDCIEFFKPRSLMRLECQKIGLSGMKP